MTLIGILIALLAQRLIGHRPRIGEPLLLERLVTGLQRHVPLPRYWASAAAPVVFLVVLTAAAGAVGWWIEQPLVDLAFDIVVLFLCLGPRHLGEDIDRLMAAREAGDEEAERTLTRALLRGPGRRTSPRMLLGALFIQSHERLFGVLLWFFVAGPAGAVLYRVASRLPRMYHATLPDSEAERIAGLQHALAAWPSGTVTTALFGLAGSLDATIRHWRTVLQSDTGPWQQRIWATIAEVSPATLLQASTETGELLPATLEACLNEVLAVQGRALLVLLAGFGLFTAGSWFT